MPALLHVEPFRASRCADRFGKALIGLAIVASCRPTRARERVGQQTISAETVPPIEGNVFRGAFSPDGEFYFFRRTSAVGQSYGIFVEHRLRGGWSPPERVDLGCTCSDLYPTISRDGTRMVFSSYRPLPGISPPTHNANLWLTHRLRGGRWGTPAPLTNASRVGTYNASPWIETDGALSYTSDDTPLRATWNGTSYDRPEIDRRVSRWQHWRSDLYVWGGTPTPDARAVVLTASRIDGLTGRRLPADLWVSEETRGTWSPPIRLGERVNTERNENFPFFSADGRALCYVRDFETFACLPRAEAMDDAKATQISRSSTTTVPIEFEDARAYVPVSVGNGVAWFILDTGAQPTLLDEGVASAMRVARTGHAVTTGAGGGQTNIATADSVRLSIDGIRLGPTEVRIAPLDSLLAPSTGQPIPGIIGSRFFREHVIELDFSWPAMHVHDPGDFVYRGRGAIVPLELENDIPFAQGWVQTPDGHRVPARFLVDLGAKATLLVTEHFVRDHALGGQFDRSVATEFGAGMGGDTHYTFVRLPSLGLSGDSLARTDSAVIGLSANGTLTSTRYDALLGAGFLSRFRVIFDYPRKRMMLEPRVPAPPVEEFDMSGLFVVANGADRRHLQVKSVRAGSPAAEAGIAPGDVVVGAEGIAFRDLSLARLRRLLRSGNGRVVSLSIERAGARRTVTLRLREFI